MVVERLERDARQTRDRTRRDGLYTGGGGWHTTHECTVASKSCLTAHRETDNESARARGLGQRKGLWPDVRRRPRPNRTRGAQAFYMWCACSRHESRREWEGDVAAPRRRRLTYKHVDTTCPPRTQGAPPYRAEKRLARATARPASRSCAQQRQRPRRPERLECQKPRRCDRANLEGFWCTAFSSRRRTGGAGLHVSRAQRRRATQHGSSDGVARRAAPSQRTAPRHGAGDALLRRDRCAVRAGECPRRELQRCGQLERAAHAQAST